MLSSRCAHEGREGGREGEREREREGGRVGRRKGERVGGRETQRVLSSKGAHTTVLRRASALNLHVVYSCKWIYHFVQMYPHSQAPIGEEINSQVFTWEGTHFHSFPVIPTSNSRL